MGERGVDGGGGIRRGEWRGVGGEGSGGGWGKSGGVGGGGGREGSGGGGWERGSQPLHKVLGFL